MDEESIFLQALQKPMPSERAAFVQQACAQDAELRRDVEGLLRAHEQAGSFLQSGLQTDTIDNCGGECPGATIGSYKLLEQIGEGGFGIVFMAEQQQPVRRKVAVKILKPGMDTRQVVARFEAERQALALMDHPGIARVFDGGQTESGRPYFVMELVKGVPLTDFCDQNQLTPRERLELFVHVCRAVQHAHQKGIIHRDLKPSNVLVTLHDGPVVKVIDFGVAKAIGGSLTEKTLFTNFAQLVGTPLYMSPEQAALSGLDVDTRSDIYSLGVLLYELLTGTTPFPKDRFQEAGYDEMLRIIREEEPPRPSTRMSTIGQGATTASPPGKNKPGRLCQLLRGELDWIVMKCLEKDRSRRYETANGLALDIERYLHDEPVQACPPSARYRLGKYLRRNKGVVSGVAGILMAGLVAAGSIGWALRDRSVRLEEEEKEQQARQSAIEQKADLALEEAARLQSLKKWPEALEAIKRAEELRAGDGGREVHRRAQALGKDIRMVLRLEEIRLPRSVDVMEGSFDMAAADVACADAFREYGIDVDTLEVEEAAGRIRASRIQMELAAGLDGWARYRDIGKNARGTSRERLLEVAQAADPDELRNQVRQALIQSNVDALNELAESDRIKDLPLQTLSLLGATLQGQAGETVLRLAQRKYPADFHINFQLAWACDHGPKVRDDAEVIRYYTVARALRPRNMPTHLFLGQALRRSGRYEEALATFRSGMDLDARQQDPLFIPLYENLNGTLHYLINQYWRAGQRNRAFALFQEELEFAKTMYGPEGPETLDVARRAAAAASIAAFEQAFAQRTSDLGPDHSDTLNAMRDLVAAHIEAGLRDGAISLLQELLARSQKTGRLEETSSVLSDLKAVCARAGRRDIAESVCRCAVEVSTRLAAEHPADAGYREYSAQQQGLLALLLIESDQLGQARLPLQDALRVFEKLAADFPEVARYRYCLADTNCCLGYLYAAGKRPKEAAEAYGRAFALYNKLPIGSPVDAAYCESWIAKGRHNQFAWFLITTDPSLRNPARAVELAKLAVEREPERGDYWNTLGAAQYRAGEWEAAIAALNRSMELRNGGDSFDWFFLAMAHWKSGRVDEARKRYEQAVEWMAKNQPGNAELRRFHAEAAEVLQVSAKSSGAQGDDTQQ
jgi:serine/threonine protein kinase